MLLHIKLKEFTIFLLTDKQEKDSLFLIFTNLLWKRCIQSFVILKLPSLCSVKNKWKLNVFKSLVLLKLLVEEQKVSLPWKLHVFNQIKKLFLWLIWIRTFYNKKLSNLILNLTKKKMLKLFLNNLLTFQIFLQTQTQVKKKFDHLLYLNSFKLI